MINGAHVVMYSKNADADREFVKNVLKFSYIDANHGWLIFKLPPSELAVHPSEEGASQEIFLMSDDLDAEISALRVAGIDCEPVSQQRWGRLTRVRLPSGAALGLYQPSHERP